ncbi:MAG TPA: site-2 protease family protein [bacterium]|jgi:Zn-dependent protease
MLGLDPTHLVNLAVALIAAATLHEFAHAYVADRLGDTTARALGRLTLNPLAHLDIVGTLMILVAGFGWAKPVPINPANFSNWRRDTILVAVAGPLANVTLLFLFGLPLKIGVVDIDVPLGQLLLTCVYINAMLAVFNLIPVPPLDGSKVLVGLLPPRLAIGYARLEPFGVIILLALIFLRLLSVIIVPPMQWLITEATGSPFFGLF